MIKCNNCGRLFASDNHLTKLLNVQTAADDEVTVPYEGQDFDEKHGTVFGGCPDCLTDAYLMDVEENKTEDLGVQMVAICREVDRSTGRVAVCQVEHEVNDHLLYALPIRARVNPELRYFVVKKEQWDSRGGHQSLTKLLKKRTLNKSHLDAIGGIQEL